MNCCKTKSRNSKTRIIYINDIEKNRDFIKNKVHNSKYTLINFLPKNLFEQFSRFMNQYFLFVACLQLWKEITPVNPMTTWIPLIVIFLIAAIKEGIDDYFRHRADKIANERIYHVIRNGNPINIHSQEISVGDVVYLQENDEIPCDLVLLSSSEMNGDCYIQTANIDGETDLKQRTSPVQTRNLTNDSEIGDLSGIVECSIPNQEIYKFDSRIKFSEQSQEFISLSHEQLLLQTTILKNTDFVYGLAVYTGNQTKFGMNKTKTPTKWTKLDKKINRTTMFIFGLQFILVVIFGVIGSLWKKNHGKKYSYLAYPDSEPFYQVFIIPLRFFLLMSYMIPISLKVTLDICKYFYALFINWDLSLWDSERNIPANAANTAISEDLGQIEYIFSDKTGTLTENIMMLKQCSINGFVYGKATLEDDPKIQRFIKNNDQYINRGKNYEISIYSSTTSDLNDLDNNLNDLDNDLNDLDNDLNDLDNDLNDLDNNLNDLDNNFNDLDNNFNQNIIQNVDSINSSKIDQDPFLFFQFFRILALCNTVIPHENSDNNLITYRSNSPDEYALVTSANSLGFSLKFRDSDNIELNIQGKPENYEIIQLLRFTSERKRMSILLRNRNTNKIYLFTKGADEVILPRLLEGQKLETSLAHLDSFAQSGLRTLCCAYRELSNMELRSFLQSYKQANVQIESRDESLNEVYEMIEKKLIFCGITAIEDKLQQEVPSTIKTFRNIGIKIWMLTGDKYKTALQIATSCNLISSDHNLVKIEGKTNSEIEESIIQGIKINQRELTHKQFDVIIEGNILDIVLEFFSQSFLELTLKASSVICCRTTPHQKALVVKLVKSTGVMTLAIGDGGNDVSMINEAHVGVGIVGREGLQASRAADYSISQFKFLKRLLLIHGRLSNYRTSLIAQYSFYKNILFCFIQILFSFWSGFSGSSFFSSYSVTGYNAIFTAFPVFVFILEQDVTSDSVYLNSYLYHDSQSGRFYNKRTVFWWIIRALYQAFVIMLFSVFVYQKYANPHDLSGADQLTASISAYTLLIIVQTLTICFESKFFTFYHSLIISIILIVYYLLTTIVNLFPNNQLYNIFFRMFQDPVHWLFLFLGSFIALAPVIFIKYWLFQYSPTRSDFVRFTEISKKKHGQPVNLADRQQIETFDLDYSFKIAPSYSSADFADFGFCSPCFDCFDCRKDYHSLVPSDSLSNLASIQPRNRSEKKNKFCYKKSKNKIDEKITLPILQTDSVESLSFSDFENK
ncbi:putative phospholipid-transporting atpase [Anaeramoeba ignava]|uniref:Phospholipid-transporting ATPase n=1 Tax=Anaeramoeba ignava TaxID=1746090 RepID=A0A9Q0LBF6_ANAIG|nr:putative phospholipid-transporting atpase [Anaeramoeba ignava]